MNVGPRSPSSESSLPRSDVVVHVEPEEASGIRERAQAAALTVGRVREVHNVNVLLQGPLPADVYAEAKRRLDAAGSTAH